MQEACQTLADPHHARSVPTRQKPRPSGTRKRTHVARAMPKSTPCKNRANCPCTSVVCTHARNVPIAPAITMQGSCHKKIKNMPRRNSGVHRPSEKTTFYEQMPQVLFAFREYFLYFLFVYCPRTFVGCFICVFRDSFRFFICLLSSDICESGFVRDSFSVNCVLSDIIKCHIIVIPTSCIQEWFRNPNPRGTRLVAQLARQR